MPFSFFTKRARDTSTILLIDIGSASVGVARMDAEEKGVPLISAVARRDIPLQEALSSAQFTAAMNRALLSALKALRSTGKVHGIVGKSSPQVFCALSSPWFILKIRRIEFARAEPFEVTERLLDMLITEDTEKLKDELYQTLPAKDVAVIERKFLQFKLNGYEVNAPYGKKTAKLEIVSATSVSSLRAIESIRRAVNYVFHAPVIHFSAFPLVAFSAIRDMVPHEQNFLFLDITGEATDVSLVEKDILAGTVSFPRGKNFFIREIANSRRTLHEEAASLLGMFLRDELDESRRKEIASVVSHSREAWIGRLKKAVASFEREGVVIPTVFFAADVEYRSFFEEMLRTADIKILDAKDREVWYLDHAGTADFIRWGSGVRRDPFLAVEALFAQKTLAKK